MRREIRNQIIMTISIAILSVGTLLAAPGKPNDKDISNAVENELMFNATTPAYLIDVTSNTGIVTLEGSVNNILAMDRAVKIARTVKGVRGVVNNIEVDAPYRSNAVLKNDIEQALLNDPATDSYEVSVKVNDGMVTLDGNVDSWQEKQLSEYVAKGVIGVKQVENNISIQYNVSRSDYEIREDVESSLQNDIRIDGALIDVKVKNGNVELSGIVGSSSEKSLAYSKAWITGVNSVDTDNLTVAKWARDDNLRENKYASKTDIEIKQAVQDAFFYDPRVLSFNPTVAVKYGVVTLSGAVDNLKAKKAAEQTAKNVVGVMRVKNHLKVRPAYIPADTDLESEVQAAMLKNPVVEKWEIDVKANNGIVYLNGTVDSYFEKSKAEDIATKTNGVINVENNLTVNDNNDYYFYDYYGWNTMYPPYHIDVEQNYKTDYAIKHDIVDELWWSPYVNQGDVTVQVDNGIATLTGTVDTKREKLFAEINALEGGANQVENNLVVDNYKP